MKNMRFLSCSTDRELHYIYMPYFFPQVISHRVYVPYFPYIPYVFPLVIYFHMFFYSIVMMDFCHPPTSRPWVLTWWPSTCHVHRSGSVSSPPPRASPGKLTLPLTSEKATWVQRNATRGVGDFLGIYIRSISIFGNNGIYLGYN